MPMIGFVPMEWNVSMSMIDAMERSERGFVPMEDRWRSINESLPEKDGIDATRDRFGGSKKTSIGSTS